MAANAERQLLNVDSYLSRPRGNPNEWTATLTRFVQTYAGTEAALLTEVDLLMSDGVSLKQLDALDAFARAHPGTVAAAKATHQRGFQLAVNIGVTGIEKRGGDPTARFMQVLDIVKELESGAYPRSEWVERAPSIVTGFFAANPAYSAENLDRVLAASYEFAKTHFTLSANPADSGIGYFLISKMPALTKLQGDEVAGMDRIFARLEQDIPDQAAVRYLRAEYYMRGMRESQSERALFLRKAIDTLAALQAEGRGLYHRKALATLSALRFAEGDWANARGDLAKYVQAYSESEWAWVAALRLGLCDQELGNAKQAAASHLATAATHGSNPVARVLGHAYAARAYEAQGQFEAALVEHQKTLAGWDNDYGPRYSLYATRPPRPSDFGLFTDDAQVLKETVPDRIAQLKRSMAQPGGALLERGRWLLDKQQRQEAIAVLAQLVTKHPRSSIVPEARYLTHRAKLELALDLADTEKPGADNAGAISALDALGREPLDFAVTAAKIARASLLWKQRAADAETSMMLALTEWHAEQRPTKPATDAGTRPDRDPQRRVSPEGRRRVHSERMERVRMASDACAVRHREPAGAGQARQRRGYASVREADTSDDQQGALPQHGGNGIAANDDGEARRHEETGAGGDHGDAQPADGRVARYPGALEQVLCGQARSLGRVGARDLPGDHRDRIHRRPAEHGGSAGDDRILRRDGRRAERSGRVGGQAADRPVDHVGRC